MGFGNKGTVDKTTTETILSPEQKELLGLSMPLVRGFQPPKFDQPTTVGWDPMQLRAQDSALGAAGRQRGLIDTGRGAWEAFLGQGPGGGVTSTPLYQDTEAAARRALSGEFMDPSSNPALAATQRAATRPLLADFRENIIPGIGGEAVTTGNFGGSRHGVAEGIAAGKLQDTMADSNARIAYSGYQSGLDALMGALGLAPQTAALDAQGRSQDLSAIGMTGGLAGLETLPAGTIGAVGDVRQQFDQSQLDARNQQDWYKTMFPWLQAQDLIAMSSGMAGGSTQTTQPTPKQNPLATILGLVSAFGSFI